MRSKWPTTIDHMVLFSGDGDFRSLVEAMQRRGSKVRVVSTLSTQTPMISDELRRQADYFVDLVSLNAEIGAIRSSARNARRHAPKRTTSSTTSEY